MRYAANTTRSDCGPIAIINILKWAGFQVTTKRHLPYLNEMCRPEGLGTSIRNLHKTLSHLKRRRFWFRYRPQAKIGAIDATLKKGGAVLLYYMSDPTQYHFTLIIQGDGDRYTVVNAFKGKTVATVSRSTIRKWGRVGHPATWHIFKYNNLEVVNGSSEQ